MDYTNVNEACLKDSFPLPRIDLIVDVSAGNGMLSFLDAFSGYHQIPMHRLDAEKTAFVTPTWATLLHYDAFLFKERHSNLSETGDKDISTTNEQDHGSLYKRHAC